MSNQEHRVSIDNGKYTFVIPDDDCRWTVFRDGDVVPWQGPHWQAFNAVQAMMFELDAARVVVAAARAALKIRCEGLMPSGAVEQALERHDRLVSSNDGPSEWATSPGL